MKTQLHVTRLVLVCTFLLSAQASFAQGYFQEVFGEIFSPSANNPISKEWERLKINFDLNTDYTKTFNPDRPISIGVGIKYKYSAVPAYIKNMHMRMDAYALDGNIAAQVVDKVGVNLHGNATVTFARLFPNKKEAILAKPYFLNRLPWNHQSALTNLGPGDVARIEMGLDNSLGVGDSRAFANNLTAGVGASLSGGSKLILDVYRMKDSHVRVRAIATRSRFIINLSAYVALTEQLDFGLGIFDKVGAIRKRFRINPLSAGISFNSSDEFPMDTFMVDYVFNLAHPDGQEGYNRLLAQMYKLEFVRILNSIRNEKEIGEKMLNLIAETEAIYHRSKGLPLIEKPIDRIFKGRTATNFLSGYVDSEIRFIVNVFKFHPDMYEAKSTVRGYDRDDKNLDLVYFNNSRSILLSIAKDQIRKVGNNSIQAVFKGRRDELSKNIEVIPNEMTDVVFTKNVEDADLSQSKINSMKYYLSTSAPDAANKIDWAAFEDGDSKTNGYIRTSIVFHNKLFSVLPPIDGAMIYTRLRKLVDEHPNKDSLPVTWTDPNGENHIHDKYELDIVDMTYKLNTIINNPDPMEKAKAYAQLRRIKLFNEVGAALVAGFLPPESLKEVMFVRASAGAADGSGFNFTYGKEEYSEIYNTLQYMLSVINDRSFDLRVQLSNYGEMLIFKMHNDGTKVCTNCDTTQIQPPLATGTE